MVRIKTAAQRKALIGKVIEWNSCGLASKSSGFVEDSLGKNLLVSGNWEWAPNMTNVKLAETERE